MKKRVAVIALGEFAVSTPFGVSPAAAASGATPRADGYLVIWSDTNATNADGTGSRSITPGDSASGNGVEDETLATRVEARAIQLDRDRAARAPRPNAITGQPVGCRDCSAPSFSDQLVRQAAHRAIHRGRSPS